MNLLLRTLALGVSVCLLPPHPLAHAAVFTPGQFKVSETGAATYTIPIQAPPGTAGMEPKLALTYNSQAGNGPLGVGWSLSGLSVVHRCAKTITQDGTNRGISYDSEDRYCIDGQRLFAISGAHGANGTEYRTERESFVKVVSYGAAGSGPVWFKAWTKSGQILEFGNTADSRIEAQGKADVRAWALNKAQDTKNNYFTVTYEEDNPNGDYRPLRIDYTGNSVTSVTPAASVQFVYATRTDTGTQYVGGSIINVMKRLINIKTYNNTSLIRDYQLAYTNQGSLALSAINSVIECNGAAVCLPATTFSWQVSSGNYGMGTLANWAAGSTIVAVGDINGDGRADILTSTSIRFATGAGFGPAIAHNIALSYSALRNVNGTVELDVGGDFLGDVNGDGLADLVMRNGTVRLSTGTGFGAAANWAPGTIIVAVGDINGDGRADILTAGLAWQASTGAGFGPSTPLNLSGSSNAAGNNRECDDGGCSWVIGTADGGDFLADVNGDGLADLVMRDGKVRLSTGAGFAAAIYWLPAPSLLNRAPAIIVAVGDFNGDGRADILTLTSDIPDLEWRVSAGIGFGPANQINQTGSNSAAKLETYCLDGCYSEIVTVPGGDFLADINGDGTADLVLRNGSIRLGTPPTPDLLTTITTGLGAVISITYATLSNSGVYTPESGGAFPVRDVLAAPLHVVSQSSSSNGLGGTLSMSYVYTGAKAHLHGRGFLGFRQVQVTDTQTGIKALTTFRQDWPYVGLPSQAKRMTSAGAVLNQTDNIFAAQALGGTRFFPFVSQSVEIGNDLSGATLPTVTTTTGFDSYGNATDITVSTGDGYSKTTTNTYFNDTVNWILGRLTRSTVTSITP